MKAKQSALTISLSSALQGAMYCFSAISDKILFSPRISCYSGILQEGGQYWTFWTNESLILSCNKLQGAHTFPHQMGIPSMWKLHFLWIFTTRSKARSDKSFIKYVTLRRYLSRSLVCLCIFTVGKGKKQLSKAVNNASYTRSLSSAACSCVTLFSGEIFCI